jgi:hypothetical protein
MNKLTINTQSRNELNASIILAATIWSLIMIFADEIATTHSLHALNLLPLLPVTIFSMALLRHFKRTAVEQVKQQTQNIVAAGLATSFFAAFFSQTAAGGFTQISAISIYSCFAISLCGMASLRKHFQS